MYSKIKIKITHNFDKYARYFSLIGYRDIFFFKVYVTKIKENCVDAV